MSANQANESIIDSTVLPSNTNNASITTSGGSSFSVSTSYSTNTGGLTIINLNPSFKEYDWQVTANSDIYGNGREIEPGLRVCNEVTTYMSGVGSCFFDVVFRKNILTFYSLYGEVSFAGGQW